MLDFSSEQFHVKVYAPPCEVAKKVLTDDALRFVGFLCYTFEDRRRALLDMRKARGLEFDSGILPNFPEPIWDPDDVNWKCAKPPSDLLDRRVEITGPVDRKMVINGLNSGANVYMADFEDSTSPTWSNLIHGQLNLIDATRCTISYTNKTTGKVYSLNNKVATLFVRPRGWHMNESHVVVNGKEASASLFDFGLFLFHNAHILIGNGSRPYFYLPKLESSLEARLWNDIFIASQRYLGIPIGMIRATVLIETITASFEMEAILYELRNHSVGLNCGRWDYIFSFIKNFKHNKEMVTPDRSYMTMTSPMMQAYVNRLIYVCHKRGTFAMGGMAATIPIKNDAVANASAMDDVQSDKLREVIAGHDGTWVAHPALVPIAREVFDQYMHGKNQISMLPSIGDNISVNDLLQVPDVLYPNLSISSIHLNAGINIVLAYTKAWLCGIGCIPLHNKMEDAATAEISRVQIWSWRYHGITTQDDGLLISADRIKTLINTEVNKNLDDLPSQKMNEAHKWLLAGKLVHDMLTNEKLDDFLTTLCYPHIRENAHGGATSITSSHIVSRL